MKKTKIIISVMALLIVSGNLFAQTWQTKDIFEKAGEIVICEPLLYKYGVAQSKDQALIKTTLADQVAREGHLCPGVTSSFIIPKLVLQYFYSESEMPVVGDLVMRSCEKDEFATRVASVLRLQPDEEHGKQTWFVDKNLEKSRVIELYFEQVSSGKNIKVSFDKPTFMSKYVDLVEFVQMKEHILHNKAEEWEEIKFRDALKAMVNDLVENGKDIYKIDVIQ